jgi:hypothetical protein
MKVERLNLAKRRAIPAAVLGFGRGLNIIVGIDGLRETA